MNLASWIILAILIAIMALALRSVLSKRKNGCCSCGSADIGNGSACNDCGSCASCHAARCALLPTVIDPDE